MLDVAMGGRIAEEMSRWSPRERFVTHNHVPHLLVYGKENVTSGASSDIRAATNISRRMVKASEPL